MSASSHSQSLLNGSASFDFKNLELVHSQVRAARVQAYVASLSGNPGWKLKQGFQEAAIP